MRASLVLPLSLLCLALPAAAQRPTARATPRITPATATRQLFLDGAGVMRWRDDSSEVRLFGANYAIMSASDWRASGYLASDRKRMVDDDMAHFARMGWDALRLASWGDWEHADTLGNLIRNEHLDLLDYVIARARERGIYLLLTPIQTYDAGWPDALHLSPAFPGFSRKYRRDELGTNPAAIRAQANYLRQLLDHVNPYTGVAIKDDPAIVMIEMINEPVHHPDHPGATAYIDTLVAAVRGTGAKQVLFHNLSQDFRIADALRRSTVQGITFGWYPTGLNSGHELRGNYLRSVDHYDPMRDSALRHMPRLVYEFDSADLRTGYMYPAMVRAFRAGGVQLAAMFSYDMLRTSSRNLGWQTHHLNLVYTPRKTMSAILAGEAMRRLPAWATYGRYPANTRFGDLRVSAEEDLGELAAQDAFIYTGDTRTAPPAPERLQRVAGAGSSPVVEYGGEGVYFLDRVRDGLWRLEVYPDAVPVRDPFEMPSPGKIVTRAIYRAWPMTVRLPGLGDDFTVQPLARGNRASSRAAGARFTVRPGVYLLSARGAVSRASLPARLGQLRFDEFRAPAPDTLPLQLVHEPRAASVRGTAVAFSARVVDTVAADSVNLFVRPVGSWFRRWPMRRAGAYGWTVEVPADSMPEGAYEYVIAVASGRHRSTWPEGTPQRPWDWDFRPGDMWRTSVVAPGTAIRLFAPATDAPRMAFSRIGDAGRSGIFRLLTAAESGLPVFRFVLPVRDGAAPADYTASLVVRDRVAERGTDASRARALRVRLRAIGARQAVHLRLVEEDGTSWSVPVTVDSAWTDRVIALSDLAVSQAPMLPQGFPGHWNYLMGPAEGRGGAGDAVRPARIERIQFSLRPEAGAPLAPDRHGVEIESVTLLVDPPR